MCRALSRLLCAERFRGCCVQSALAAAAITPTPAEKGLARLSVALASSALVNKDVLWTRCGALDKMAPHSAVLLHSHSVKCQESRTGVTASNRRNRLDRAESVVTAGTAEAAVEHHRFMQIFDVHLQCSSVPEHATFFDPSRLRSLLLGARAFHTGESRPREVDAVDLPPHVAGAADHRVGRLLSPIASRPTASDRDSLGVPRRLLLPRSEYVSNFFDPSRLCSLLPDDRALHTGDSRPREVDAVDLPPHVAGATNKHGRRDEQTSRRLELAGPPYPIAPRPVASNRASPDAPQHHRPPRPPKLSSRDKRALYEQRPADESQVALRLEMDTWFEMDIDMEDVPNGAVPWPLRAGPSSDTSEECDGWRRELGDSEVA